MDTTSRRAQLRRLVHEHWGAVFEYAYRMTLDRDRAAKFVEDTFLRTYLGLESLPAPPKIKAWLLKICHSLLEAKLPRAPEVSFDMLDDVLRSEATRTDVVRSLSNPQRDFMLWELKQGCMTAVVNCLSPGERSAFVAANVLKLDIDDAASMLGIATSAYKVRLSRAQKKIADYLAPRCEHVDPLNPCRCPARVGVALRKGFIRGAGEVSVRSKIQPFGRYGSGASNDDAPLRDVTAIYQSLPPPDAPEGLAERIVAKLNDGAWEELLAKKQAES